MNTTETKPGTVRTGLGIPGTQASAWLSAITIGCVVFDMVALVLLHVLQPGIDPLRRAMSNYVLGPYGFLMTLVVLSAPVMMASLATGLHRSLAKPLVRSRLRMIPMGVAGLGFVLLAIYAKSSTVSDDIVTTADRIHAVAGFIGTLWVHVVMLLYSVRFRTDARWQPFARHSMLLAVAALITFALLFIIVPALALPAAGLMQRLNVFLILLWLFLAALRLRTITK